MKNQKNSKREPKQLSQKIQKNIKATLKKHQYRKEGAILLGGEKNRKEIYLDFKRLITHVHGIGPTGVGKTMMMRNLFRQLANHPTKPCVIVLDPKSDQDLYQGCVRDTAAMNLDERVVLFDSSRDDYIVGYNPLRPNGLTSSGT